MIFRPVVGFEKLYEVSACGVVKSLGRTTIGGSRGGPCNKTYKPRLLALLNDGADRKRKRRDRRRVMLYPLTHGSKPRPVKMYVLDLVKDAWGAEIAAKLPLIFQRVR